MTGLLDTHLHLICRDRLGYGWADAIPVLAGRDFTLADYRADCGAAPLLGSLFLETGVDDADYRAETRRMSALARDDRNAIRAVIASCRPETDAGFDAWLDEAAGLGVRGFRRILHVKGDEVSQSPTFRANIRKIGARGLVFDMCFLARQLPIAVRLAAACDAQPLVLDHCGVANVDEIGFETWQASISALAAMPHVYCKLTGALTYCLPPDPDPGAIRRYTDHIIAKFGPDRLLWGSDWPVVNLGKGVGHWLAVTARILDALSRDEATAIGHRTAARIYRVDPA